MEVREGAVNEDVPLGLIASSTQTAPHLGKRAQRHLFVNLLKIISDIVLMLKK